MIGRVFGQRYRLEEFVGKGGMALVFRAVDTRTGHDVAVKQARPPGICRTAGKGDRTRPGPAREMVRTDRRRAARTGNMP